MKRIDIGLMMLVSMMLSALATVGWAQNVTIETPNPMPELLIPVPEPRPEPRPETPALGTAPSALDTPGFIGPLTVETETGRMGVSGWTASNPEAGLVGAPPHESPGTFSLGFTWMWDRPPLLLPLR